MDLRLAAILLLLLAGAGDAHIPDRRSQADLTWTAISFTNIDVIAELKNAHASCRRVTDSGCAVLVGHSPWRRRKNARPAVRLRPRVDRRTVVMLVDVLRVDAGERRRAARLDAAASAMRTVIDPLPSTTDTMAVQFRTEPRCCVSRTPTTFRSGRASATSQPRRAPAIGGRRRRCGNSRIGAIRLRSEEL